MSTTNGGQNSDLKPEDFDAIREAVMETPRGRWFLSEYANRLRASEAGSVIESMKRLEQAVSANHDRIMQRLAEALTNEPRASASLPPAVRPQPDLAPGQLKYFKQDEEIFGRAAEAKGAPGDHADHDYAKLELRQRQPLKPGDFYALTPENDIHRVRTTSDVTSVSLHLLGNDNGCIWRHRFDPDAATVAPFRSGWLNTECRTYEE